MWINGENGCFATTTQLVLDSQSLMPILKGAHIQRPMGILKKKKIQRSRDCKQLSAIPLLWANTIFCQVVQVIDLNTINVSSFFTSKSIGYVFSWKNDKNVKKKTKTFNRLKLLDFTSFFCPPSSRSGANQISTFCIVPVMNRQRLAHECLWHYIHRYWHIHIRVTKHISVNTWLLILTQFCHISKSALL